VVRTDKNVYPTIKVTPMVRTDKNSLLNRMVEDSVLDSENLWSGLSVRRHL